MSKPASAKTQRAIILRLLLHARGAWVPLPEIMACAAQYNARIFELRRLGFDVENRTQTDPETGTRHSWFRLAPNSSQEPGELAKVGPPKPVESDYMRRIREERARALPLFVGVRG